jgi:signal transduction histidine kinase
MQTFMGDRDPQPPTAPPPPERPFGLRSRLLLALSGLAALLALALLGWIEPHTHRALSTFGARVLDDSSTTMHALALEQNDQGRDTLVDLLRGSELDRQRAIEQLPAAATPDLREALLAAERSRGQHWRQRGTAAADELLARAEASIDVRLRALQRAQSAHAAEFLHDLRATHLLLLASLLLTLLAVFGLGLERFVIAPTRRLRAAVQRVAGGELEIDLPRAGRSELGQLSSDFATMVTQLRGARDQLQRFATGLEHEVGKQTAHLEQALRDLRSSHQQLAQAERLAALGTLAGGIAHEFHNLIGGIRGCASELQTSETDAERKETLAVITRAADRGTGIVQQLLRFARRSVERHERLDPAAVAGDALALCEPAARRQQITVDRRFTSGLELRGDGDALHQVLVNLLLNALQAMGSGGTLRVAIDGDDAEVRIAIADTGRGIAPADLPHLFEPFFTTRHGDDGQRRGTGLGLSVSWGLVQAHGGRIDVQSTLGQGTTFTVRLPRGVGAANDGEARPLQ